MSIRSFTKKYQAEITAIGALLGLLAIILFIWKPTLKPFSIVSIVMAIPELALRILVIFLFILAIYIIVKIRTLLNPDFLDLSENFKNHKEGNNKFAEDIRGQISQVRTTANYVYNRFQKYEELDRDDEIRFILDMVGDTQKKKMREEDIKEKYFEKFRDKRFLDFNSLWENCILRKDFLEQERDSTGYGGTEYYCITTKGYAYLKYRKIDKEENDKETPQ